MNGNCGESKVSTEGIDCGDYRNQLLGRSLIIYLDGEEPKHVPNEDILRYIWGGDLETRCMTCQKSINGVTDLLIRTISLAAPRYSLPASSTSMKIGGTNNIELRIHNYHYECMRKSGQSFIPVSHAWHEPVANAMLNGLQNDREAAKYTINTPFHVLLAATEAYGPGTEIWHDYISIPQWQSGRTVQKKILASLPEIFASAQCALVHLDDVPDDCIHGLEHTIKEWERSVSTMERDSISEEFISHVNTFLGSRWFKRMWVCIEYARSLKVHLLTKDFTVVKSSESLFLNEIAWARGLMQLETHPDKFSALIRDAPDFVWETWKGLLGFKTGKVPSFGVAMSILAEKACRTYEDRFTAINVLLDLDIGDSLLLSTSIESCKLAAWKSLRKGDYTPLLLAPCGETEIASAPWLKGYERMVPEMWTLRGQRGSAKDLKIIRANRIMPRLEVIGILTEWQYQSFEDFETVVRKIIQNTGANATEFTNTIARLYIDQDHALVLSPKEIPVQTPNYHPDGRYISRVDPKYTERLEELLSSVPSGGDTPMLRELVHLMGLDKPAVGSDTRLQFGARVAPRYHGKDKDALGSVCCKICLKISTFRMALWVEPGNCAQVYRIPGLWLQRSLPNGVGLVISAGRIVGRLVYGTPACECHELETVLIV